MAVGTIAGAVDLSFSSSTNLEIFKLGFQSEERDLPLVGESSNSERFNRLAWVRNGSGFEEFSLGLIVGGLVDGSIALWNPLSLIGYEFRFLGIHSLLELLCLFGDPLSTLSFFQFPVQSEDTRWTSYSSQRTCLWS